MATLDTPKAGYPSEIIGYVDPWIASPGLQYNLFDIFEKISSTEPEYDYRTVRLIQGVEVDHAPLKQEEEVTQIPRGKGKGRFQLARPGSYALVEDWAPPQTERGLEISLYMQPHLPDCVHTQTIISTLNSKSKTGFALGISQTGRIEVLIGTGKIVDVVTTHFSPVRRQWVEVQVFIERTTLKLALKPMAHFAEKPPPPFDLEVELSNEAIVFESGPITFGASYAASSDPTLKTVGDSSRLLVQYDFAREMRSDRIIDISGLGHDGILVNAPTRAVRGYDWDGSEPDWTKAKSGYGAIHFHDDDLDDAAWLPDVTVTIPANARSGAYAIDVKSTNGKSSDMIPFFVRPSKAAMENSAGKIAFVLSTFTYLAYANERLYDESKSSSIDVGPGFDRSSIHKSEDFHRMERRTDLGISNYDVHNDDSPTVFSSAKRPILNIRPGYFMWAFNRPREFSADLMMIGFLEREGIPYEVVTDHDLHTDGVAALSSFNTVITGSHPEYPSLESFNAYISYAKQGGNLMYLGGNGFYWVSATDSLRPHRMEVRRGDVGVRSYTVPGGERVHSLNGQQGSLWRSRGMACNVLFAIGFCAEGVAPGVPFKRTEASKNDPSLAWIFEGIREDDLIGVHGLGGGASGDEIDRFDVANGSPANAIVLATSTGHPDDFGIVPEDTTFPILNTLGTQTDLIRSDITYYETSGGGAVFSVGSINWLCSLGWDDYKNNVARMTLNVLQGFMKRRRPE